MANCLNGNKTLLNPENSKALVGNRPENKVYPQETAYNPPEDIELNTLLAENEWLRQELYYDQNNEMNRQIHYFTRHNYTLSQFVAIIDSIHKLTSIRKQDVYGIVYSTLTAGQGQHYINFKDKKPSESKLRYIWRVGYLPVAYHIAKGMLDGMNRLKFLAPTEFNALTSKLQSQFDKQKQKVKAAQKKKVNKLVPF